MLNGRLTYLAKPASAPVDKWLPLLREDGSALQGSGGLPAEVHHRSGFRV